MPPIALCWKPKPSLRFSPSTRVWFHNLKKLELAANWRFLLKFLEYAPNLRLLIIIPKIDKHDLQSWEEREPQQVHRCLTSHLTSVIIHEFEQDLEMVRYFLRNAKMLKTMDIYFRVDENFNNDQKRDARKSISLFERGFTEILLSIYSIKTYKN